jgi:hypothetical protein
MLQWISRGGGPRTLYDATCSDKQMGEENQALPGNRKLAEPIKAERAGTSDPVSGSASELAMARETEPMADAPFRDGACRLGSGRVDLSGKPRIGGVLVRAIWTRTGGAQLAVRQPRHEFAWRRGRIPHGVESAPKASKRSVAEPKNLVTISGGFGRRTTEAASDRGAEGRSLRSSPRTGKPFTWRREAVDTACKQEAGTCPAG